MRLFGNATSPFVRKVAVTAAELGLQLECVVTDPRDASSGFWARNPLAKIPALETDHGAVLFDSPVIVAYLDEVHGGGRLLPAAGPARWAVLTMAALADGILDAGLLARQEGLRPAGEQSRAWTEKQMAIAARGLDRLEREAAGFADRIDHATIAVACTIGWLRFRHGALDWLSGRPQLAGWYEAFAARPSMQATVPSAT